MIELHKRLIFLNIYDECQKVKINPYFESDKLPIVKREIENGILCILNRNKDIKREYISWKIDVINNELIFGIIAEQGERNGN